MKWNLHIYHIGLGFIIFSKLVYLIRVLLFLSVSSSFLVSETVSLTGLTISCNKTSDWLILGQVNFEKCDHILESWWVKVLNNSVGPKRLAKKWANFSDSLQQTVWCAKCKKCLYWRRRAHLSSETIPCEYFKDFYTEVNFSLSPFLSLVNGSSSADTLVGIKL